VTYLLFQLGALAGFFAARQLDEFMLTLRLHGFHRRLGPVVAALVATAGPGFAHLLMGRFVTAAYILGTLVTMLGLVPVPLQLSSIPFGLSLVPLWLLNIGDAWWLGRRLNSVGEV